jgi:hypothetical protein
MTAAVDYHADFYIASATLIPVVWLTAGFASQATSGMMQLLAHVESLSDRWDIVAGVPGVVAERITTRRFKPVAAASGTVARQLLRAPVWVSLSRARLVGMAVFVSAGLVGESASLLALALEDPSRTLRIVTLISVLVLVGMGGVVLAIALWGVAQPVGSSLQEKRADVRQAQDSIAEAVAAGDKDRLIAVMTDLVVGTSEPQNEPEPS